MIDAYLQTDGQVRRHNILQSGTTAVTVVTRECSAVRLFTPETVSHGRSQNARATRSCSTQRTWAILVPLSGAVHFCRFART
jgi:hypothetical protein